jgi:hypothetical protein
MVVLSPYDKFDFSVGQGDPRPIMRWTKDNSCVIGPKAPEQAAHAQMFPEHSEFVSSDGAMTVGHLEVLGLVSLDNVCLSTDGTPLPFPAVAGLCIPAGISAAAAAKHDDTTGKPANCGVLQDLMGSPTKVSILKGDNPTPGASSTASFTTPVLRSLIGRYVITDAAGGIEAGADAIELRHTNFGGDTNEANLLSAQSATPCSASGNCTSRYAWDTLEYDHPHFGEMANLANLEHALTAGTLSGDWSNNPDNYVGVDWIVSFPTKYAYLDYVEKGKCHNSNVSDGSDTTLGWCLKTPNPGWQNNPLYAPVVHDDDVWTHDNTTETCLKSNPLAMYGQDEQEASSVNVSPGGNQLNLCNEVNIFALADDSQTPRASVIQTSMRRTTINGAVDAIRGWAQMGLNWVSTPSDVNGGAVTGEIFTTRATTEPANNNGSLTDLKKDVGDGFIFTVVNGGG